MVRWLWGAVIIVVIGVGVLPASRATTKIQIIQTADLHSHFIDRDSPMRMGGLARIKHQIDYLKTTNENTLVLDAGDWSEGSMFFTLNSGEASQRLLEAVGYDAIVMGNHDWLVGPQELSEAFTKSGLSIPVLGANLNMDHVPASLNLKKIIKPYVVKVVGGVRVGIFGLSTFQLIYDSFFDPVKINEPFLTAINMVHQLRTVEKCDVVIALTHLGIDMDKMVARFVPGIDLIVGGHTHIRLKDPVVVSGTPIVHVGKWGMYVGQYELTVEDDKSVSLTNWKLHQIDRTIPEDPMVRTMVEGFERDLEKKFGPVLDNKVVYSDVYLHTLDNYGDDPLGNWSADAIRDVGDADVSFNHVKFTSRDLYQGWSSTFDLFNLSPAIFQAKTQKAWTVNTFELPGFALKLLINGFLKFGGGLRVSNSHIIFDPTKLLPVQQLTIGGQPVEDRKYYKVAGTQGVLETFSILKKYIGTDLGIRNLKDTGKEAWRALGERLQTLSPITTAKAYWQGRIRTVQPDLHIPAEQVQIYGKYPNKMIRVQLINAGLTEVKLPPLQVWINKVPAHTLEDAWEQLPERKPTGAETVKVIPAGQWVVYDIPWESAKNLVPGVYPILVSVAVAPGEAETRNNSIETYLNLTRD